MAGGHGGKSGGGGMNPMDDVKWILIILGVLGLAWAYSGGLNQASNWNPFVKPPAPISSGDTYGVDPAGNIRKPGGPSSGSGSGSTGSGKGGTGGTGTTPAGSYSPLTGKTSPVSPLSQKITIDGIETAYEERNPADKESVTIRASENATAPILISGLTIESVVTGKKITIPRAYGLPMPGTVGFDEPVYLRPGEQAIITTGRSPNGLSFRTNICTGHFEQFQNFTPSLSRECPRYPTSLLPKAPNALPDACLDFIEDLPRCHVVTEMPLELTGECSAFIAKEINYNRCVEINRSNSNFFGNEWRLFLGRGDTLWKSERETIRILDIEGKVVTTYSY